MQVSLDWLSEFVELPETDTLVSELTDSGIEVEEVLIPGSAVDGVVVARVASMEPHPDADKLKVCQVDDGSGELKQVVCGAPNVFEGMTVAYAQVGASLPEFKISKRKLRGVQSLGMLCGRSELGLEDEIDGLWELPSEGLELGRPVFTALKMTGALALGLTPNRPDLLSHVGVAREIAASTSGKLRSPKAMAVERGPATSQYIDVVLDSPEDCPRYVARLVRNVEIKESPQWLKTRLESVGLRSINNIVDITNYVMMELGHPLHAFDAAKLSHDGGKVELHIRKATAGETLATLDGAEHTLSENDLVIADRDKAVALAGVMGGANSEVDESTKDVLLEVAYFEPRGIRRTARRLGIHTDSSHRFERGVDPNALVKVIDRAAQLIGELAGGECCKGVIDEGQRQFPEVDTTVRYQQVGRVLGVSLAAETISHLLEPLGIRSVSKNEDSIRLSVPTFRPDIRREIDVIEEIARRYGFDQLEETLPSVGGRAGNDAFVGRLEDELSRVLRASGFDECINYGFGSPASFASSPIFGDESAVVTVLNALGENYSGLRTSIIPGLLENLRLNRRRGASSLRLFEIGHVFTQREDSSGLDEKDSLLPDERPAVAIVMGGGRYDGRWFEGSEEIDATDLLGVFERIAQLVGYQAADLKPLELSTLSPTCSAAIVLKNGAHVGALGQIHPRLLKTLDVQGPVFALELDLNHAKTHEDTSTYQPLPRFPGTRRDVAVVAPKVMPSATIQDFIREHSSHELPNEWVENVRLFDVYDGKGVEDGMVSLAYAIHYRASDRTLTDEEVAPAFEHLLGSIREKLKLEIR